MMLAGCRGFEVAEHRYCEAVSMIPQSVLYLVDKVIK
jgi:hypothetical protein